MKVAWLGPKRMTVIGDRFRAMAEKLGLEYSVLSESEGVGSPLGTGGVSEELERFDVILCPIEPEPAPYPRGSRRLIQSLATGKPVIASSLAAHMPLLKAGQNGFVARNSDDWESYLIILRDQPQLRHLMGESARVSVQRFTDAGGTRSIRGRQLSRPLVAFYLGPGLEKWDERNLKSGIGGSETAAVLLGRGLSRLGYHVKLFADPPVEKMDSGGYDVEFRHWSSWGRFARENFIDHLVCSRTVYPLEGLVHAHRRYVWMHDTSLSLDPSYDCRVGDVDFFLCLSDWHKEHVHEHHRIPLEKILVTTNGIDPARFDAIDVERNPTQAIYSSSPDRGLDILLYCSEEIVRYVPGLRIKVAYGFENWEKLVRRRGEPSDTYVMESIKRGLSKPWVDYLGRIGQDELAAHQKASSAWLYPTRWCETNCITAIESGYAGAALLSSHLSGLTTTVSDEAGILLRGCNLEREYHERFIEESVRLLTDRAYRDEWGEKARRRMQRFTWERVARQWHELFETGRFERIQ